MISKKSASAIPRQSSYNSLHDNPFNERRHNRSNSEGGNYLRNSNDDDNNKYLKENPLVLNDNKENAVPKKQEKAFPSDDKENVAAIANGSASFAPPTNLKSSLSTASCNKALKPSSLQFCMQVNEPDKVFGGSKILDPTDSENSTSLKIWDYSDSEAAPASSWSTLPNKSLLCRPLPLDIGKCTCVIVKEASSEGFDGVTLYSLYTNEGRGRQDRKLAVANYKRRNGRSEFTVAQTMQGISSTSDDSFLGTVTASLMGSKYHIWDQGSDLNTLNKQSKSLLGVVAFIPTITTWTGSYRSMRAYIAKHQSMQLKNSTQVQHVKGLPNDWEGKKEKVHQLFSRIPQYNKLSRQYELDFRDKGRAGLRIQSSVKNFQLTLEVLSVSMTQLQLGKLYPLTGYQAFCICLASIDSKLCCSL
ncbi:hypothetical protein L484_004405 [Morus notabilis]|uniref:Tubby C-terminal domain-containing protein n=1 Tax=Morus notabilis TaxID=981085 RepID=W9SKJ7_9ROSA|nr:hypothetical protein L484_004405 [Morus notabilis]